jgi:DNA polymerase-3 subunit chi
MSEIFFYHLTQTRLEVALPKILERALSADWSIELRTGVEANLDAISDAIWKGPDESFLPHCFQGNDNLQENPIVISKSPLLEIRDCLVVVERAEVTKNEVGKFKRVCLLFDSKNEVELTSARECWKSLSGAGLKTVYWAEDRGQWKKKQ